MIPYFGVSIQLPKRVTMRKQTKTFQTAMNIRNDCRDERIFLTWSVEAEELSMSNPSSSFRLDSLKFKTAPALASRVAAIIKFDSMICRTSKM